jgi:hypothetical protein
MKLKLFIVGLLLGFVVMMPGSASAQGIGHRILPFKTGVEATKTDENWKRCGNYFATIETTSGKIVYFTFEKELSDKLSVGLIFTTVDQIVVSINEKAATPLVATMGAKFFIVMNMQDYRVGLPCLGNGEKI